MARSHRALLVLPLWLLLASATAPLRAAEGPPPDSREAVVTILHALSQDGDERDQALDYLEESWDEDFTPMALELLRYSRDRVVQRRLLRILRKKTGQNYRGDLNAWYEWLWSQPPTDHPDYASFKKALYGLMDPKFRAYFTPRRTTKIRLDEVVWGGVVQDGIPPLDDPKMVSADEADYLDDDNVVFGIEIDGDARAYPKRILAWHEMFVDTVGGEKVAGVYCTLCGTVILYKTVHDGVEHELGTSGFLYRSNKLMYDKATQSLWNTLWGRPVIGPLADEDIELERGWVVTTTWGEWRRRHPDTTVLSIDTGFDRDYSEGAAYRDYFATDEIMFAVPELDDRLKNKDEVLALRFDRAGEERLAIAAEFLEKNPVYQDRLGPISFVVVTDESGANRVYEAGDHRFTSYDGAATVIDSEGARWTLTEEALVSPDGERFERLPAHRAFWFGWYAAYPETRLVK